MCKINKTETCWLWTAALCHFGHGNFWNNGRNVKANRFAYELWKGPIPPDMCVRHTCDEPSCVNPEHLLLGTQQDNMRDKVERNRQAKGEKNGSAKLTEDIVREIRILRGFDFTTAELSNTYKVNKSTILRILSREKWKHII